MKKSWTLEIEMRTKRIFSFKVAFSMALGKRLDDKMVEGVSPLSKNTKVVDIIKCQIHVV